MNTKFRLLSTLSLLIGLTSASYAVDITWQQVPSSSSYNQPSMSYDSAGTTYSRIGNITYGSNGNTYNHVGNSTYGSDGSTCSRLAINTGYICNGD